MDVLKHVFVAIHLVSMAAIVGIWFANFRRPSVLLGQVLGACGTLLTGLALVGLAEAAAADVNHAKIGVKLTLALVVLVSAIIGYRKARTGQPVSKGLAHGVGGTALINVLIAALWN